MTRYALRLQVIPTFGDPLDQQYGHMFEIADQLEGETHPEILDRIITEHLRGSLNEIIEARRNNERLIEGTRMPGDADAITPDDILAARDEILNTPRRGGRNNFMEQMLARGREVLRRTGQMPTFVATDEAQAETTFQNAARFWVGADGTPQFSFDPATPIRPRPAASHALWPLTAPES